MIARELKLRKTDALQAIRELKVAPKEVKKVTRIGKTTKPIVLDQATERFTETLYKQGYPDTFIYKLVNKKHPEFSQYRIRKYLTNYKKQNPSSIEGHKANMKFYKATGKYKQHLDAKFYRETEKHYSPKFQFKEGTPKIEVNEDEIEV